MNKSKHDIDSLRYHEERKPEKFSERFKKRTRLLFVPFLKILFAFVFGYNFLSWVIGVLANQVSIKELFIHAWLPSVLIIIAHVIWLRPRIRLFNFKWYRWRYSLGYHIIPIFIITAVTMFAQDYLDRVTSNLTPLEHIDQLDDHRRTKFYTLKEFYFDKSNIGTNFSSEIERDSKKKWYKKSAVRTKLKMTIVVPILASINDTTKMQCTAWLGIQYKEEVDYEVVNKAEFLAYQTKCLEDFYTKNLDQFIYLDKIRSSEEEKGYNQAISNSETRSLEDAPIFSSVNEPFEKRTAEPFGWFVATLFIGCFIWLILILIPKLEDERVEIFEQKLKNKKKKKENYFDGSSTYRK